MRYGAHSPGEILALTITQKKAQERMADSIERIEKILMRDNEPHV
jgi:hypothetical protein